MTTQLSLSFDPGLADQHRSLKECVACRIYQQRGGVTAVDVNLKFVWEVVSRIQVGQGGLAYVVDDKGALIAHPDISLVLKKTELSALPQVAASCRA